MLDLTTNYGGHLNYYKQLFDWQADNEQKLLQKSRLNRALEKLQSTYTTYDEAAEQAKELKEDAIYDMRAFISNFKTTDEKVIKTIQKYADDNGDDKTIDQSTPKSLLQKYYTQKNNYIIYNQLRKKYEEQISPVKKQIREIQDEIEQEIKNKKIIEGAFYKKYERFISEGSWVDESYYDDDLYYLDAQNVLYNSAYPQVSYTFNVLDLDELTGYRLINDGKRICKRKI